MLRSGALRDPRVIEVIEKSFVPIWINVRTTPLPAKPWVRDLLVNASVDDRNMVSDLFSQGFFVRSAVLTPDGETLLNAGPKTMAASMSRLAMGDNVYAKVDPEEYLVMLRESLERFEYRQHHEQVCSGPSGKTRLDCRD